MKTFLGVIGTLAGILGALYLGLFAMLDGMPTWRIVGVIMVGILALVAGIGLTLAIIYRLSGRARVVAADQGPAIDAEYRMLANYRPPQVQLQAAPVINVPAYRANGQAQPFGMPTLQAPILRTITDTGELAVPLNKLVRFMACSTPARSEWIGRPDLYGACLAFASEHGLLTRTANGGARWKPEYPLEARKAWLAQFDLGTGENNHET